MAIREERDERVCDSTSVRGLHQQAVLEDGVNLDRATVASGDRGQAVRSCLDENKAERLLQRNVHKGAPRGGGNCVAAISRERSTQGPRATHMSRYR